MNKLWKERHRIVSTLNGDLRIQRSNITVLGLIKLILLGLSLLAPLLFKVLIDDVMVGQKLDLLIWVCGGYVCLYVVETIILGLQRKRSNILGNKLMFSIRRKIWRNYTSMPMSSYENKGLGDLKNIVDQDIEAVERFVRQHLLDYGYHWLYVIASGVIMFVLNWKLAIFGMLMVPLSFWMTRRLGKGAKIASDHYRNTFGEYEGWLHNSLQAWKEIKASNAEKYSSILFTRYWHRLSKLFFIRHIYWYGNRSFIAIKDFFITRMNLYFVGGLLILNGELTIGGLLIFMKYYEQFFNEMSEIHNLDMQLTGELASLERVAGVLQSEKIVRKDGTNSGAKRWSLSEGYIKFDDVTFNYDAQVDKPTLVQLNFHVIPGERIAIVGRSGSGKSTVAKLLIGLYSPQTGNIYIDECNIAEIPANHLHREIGFVTQEPIFFNQSIRDNLKLGAPKATEIEMIEACNQADIGEFIQCLANGYDTLIGEKGIKLSGGQKQRLAIARVLLTGSKIIVMDEATSQLDHESEKRIHQSITQMFSGKTWIIIAHRLSSVITSDRVIVIDSGRIVGNGHHLQLLQDNEVYRALFQY